MKRGGRAKGGPIKVEAHHADIYQTKGGEHAWYDDEGAQKNKRIQKADGGSTGGHKWMQKAFANSHGQFREKAHKAGMSTTAYAKKEAGDPHASTKTKRQANLAKLGMKYGKH